LIVLRLFSRRALNRAVPIVVGVGALTVAIIAVVILISRDASRQAGDTLRADLWSTAVTLIRLDPFTGAGVGMFGRGHRLYRDGTYVDDRLSTAHNLYLNTAAETGIFSLVIIGAGTLAAMRVWVRQWRTAKRDTRKLRLEAAFAALAAFAVQSLFDTFTLTGIVVLPLVLLAYCITPTRFITDAVIRGSKLPAFAFAGLIAAFGVGLWLSDRAHAAFNASVTHQSLRDAQTALSFDPSMRLYQLQVDYLTAAQTDDLPTAIRAYENATALEPTWDTGWINLAVLYSRAGDDAAARSSLERAASISNWNSAAFGWAFLSEITETASQPEITAAYLRSITYPPPNIDWWISTPARRAAYERYTAENPIIPTSGDEYVRRAYAAFPDDPAAAQRFLAIAERLGPFTENIALARVDLAPSPDARRAAMIAIVGSRAISQNFEAVLYQGRRAQFEPLPGLTSPPPTDQDLRVWFELAQSFADEGDPQTARQVYELMIQRHPNLVSDQRARIDAAVRALEEP
jgi:tetratricopeptide (TPR) repeat protein